LKNHSKFYFYVIYGVLYIFIVSNLDILVILTKNIFEHNRFLSIILSNISNVRLSYLYSNILKEALILVTIIDVIYDKFCGLNIGSE